MNGAAVDTTNGAGPRNLQLFVLAPDGTVLHCLPGYWHASDLLLELDLADRLYAIWQDQSIRPEDKKVLFAKAQERHIGEHPYEMVNRSKLQGFDKVHIFHHKDQLSDAISSPNMLVNADKHHLPDEAFKTTDKIMHDRLSTRPFVAYQNFDVANYVNYGTNHYDKGEHKLDPTFDARVRVKNLREVLHETWTPEKKVEKKKPVKVTWDDVAQISTVDKKLEGSFWAHAERQDWAKAKRIADYFMKRQANKPLGFQMGAVVAYGQKDFISASRLAYKAIQLGSRQPALLALYKQACDKTRQRAMR